MKEQRVVPADVYDTYELAAEAYGGVGAGKSHDGEYGSQRTPYCQAGYLDFFQGILDGPYAIIQAQDPLDLYRYDVTVFNNDDAVRAINKRKGRTNLDARVSWQEYAEELGLVRGDA